MRMNKVTILVLLALINVITFAQSNMSKQKIHVTAISGKVMYNDSILKKNDTILFDFATSALNHFRFSSKTDWIRVRNPEKNTILTFYASKPHSCVGCLGTRGFKEIANDSDFQVHFSKPLLVFDSDTIILKRTSLRTGNDEVLLWIFNLPFEREEPFYTYAGKNDTLFISHKMLFDELDDEIRYFASIYVENIRLAVHNTKTKETVYPKNMPAITLFFFDDVVRYLYSMGMNDEEVYMEVITNYINGEGVLGKNNLLNSEKEAEDWLKKRIEHVKHKK